MLDLLCHSCRGTRVSRESIEGRFKKYKPYTDGLNEHRSHATAPPYVGMTCFLMPAKQLFLQNANHTILKKCIFAVYTFIAHLIFFP